MFMFVNLSNLSVNTNSVNGETYHRSSKVALTAHLQRLVCTVITSLTLYIVVLRLKN